MSADAFNRIAALERKVRELETLITQAIDNAAFTSNPRTQACESERPSKPNTLSLRKKGEISHA